MNGNCSLAFYCIRLSCDFVLSFYCISFQSYKFDAMVSSGSKRSRCSFTLVLKDEEIDDINIKCNTEPKKKMKITDFVLVSKTMKKFTVSFTIHRSMTRILSSAVETGWQVSLFIFCTYCWLFASKILKSRNREVVMEN